MKAPPANTDQLEELLSRPTDAVREDLKDLDGDLLVLGAGGKMGPTLARMARRALEDAGTGRGVIAVARWSDRVSERRLGDAGVRTLTCDLLDREAVARLPDAAALLFLAGTKFGTGSIPSLTWALNAWVPTIVAERYRGIPTVVFSSGNVYPLVPATSAGATEATPPSPVGEYAWSVLARERVFEHASLTLGTPVLQYRLNYAAELRYGVLVDVALKVRDGRPVDLSMGHANVIWQGDANAMALRCLRRTGTPSRVLNVTGLEKVSIRDLAATFGRLLGRDPILEGTEEPTALLSDASAAHHEMGPATVSLDQLVTWVAHWVRQGGEILGRPTHYQVRDGSF